MYSCYYYLLDTNGSPALKFIKIFRKIASPPSLRRADALLPATCLLSLLPAPPAIIASPGKLVALQREWEHSATHFCQINMQPQQFWSWVTKIKYFEFLLPTILFIMKIYTMILIPAVHFSYSVPKGDRLSHF